MAPGSIAPWPVDEMAQRVALLAGPDLVGDGTRDRIGVAVGGVVGRDRNAGMGPERVRSRQRLCLEDVEHGVAKAPLVETGEDICFDLQPAATRIDEHGFAERAILRKTAQKRHIDHVPRVACQRQQDDENVGGCEKGVKAVGAMMAAHARQRLDRPAPAGDLEAETGQHLRRIPRDCAEPHEPDAEILRRPLVRADPRAAELRCAMQRSLAMLVEHMPDNVLGHPARQIRIDHARDRHMLGQTHIGEERIDTGADTRLK